MSLHFPHGHLKGVFIIWLEPVHARTIENKHIEKLKINEKKVFLQPY